MITIDINKLSYLKEAKAFFGSEKDIPFATTYTVHNPKTGNSVDFEFIHSTGPEFDPETVYVYESKSGLRLHVANDKRVTGIRAAMYEKAKLR